MCLTILPDLIYLRTMHIETERLIMRELIPEDAEGMYILDSDPEVHRYVGNKPVTSIAQCREVIAFIREQYKTNGVGRLAVIDRHTADFVGWSGVKLFKDTVNGHKDFYEIGYRFIKAHWGKGYATESAKAILKHSFATLPTDEIFAMTDVDNQQSRKVLEKIGLKHVETFNYDTDGINNWRSGGEPTTWYSITREEYSKQ